MVTKKVVQIYQKQLVYWYSNKNNITNSIENNSKWQIYRTFENSGTVSLLTDFSNAYNRQGLVLVTNDQGDSRVCYTDVYSNKAYTRLTKKGNTSVYIKVGETCNGYNNTLSYINTLYAKVPYLFKNSSIFISGNDAVTYGSYKDSSVNLPCNDKNTYIGVIHEMAHVWDRNASVKYGNRISESTEMQRLMKKYNNDNNLANGTGLNCPYSWFYDQKNEFEFFVGIYTHYYLDKYYKNKSSSEIDKLHIHDCWKWMLKNRSIDNDIKNFVENAIKKYK